MKIKNKEILRDERVDYINEYIDELIIFFEINETIFLTDEQLYQCFKDQNLEFIYKKIGKYSLRIVEYNAPYGLFGTLNGRWIIAQYYDGENTLSQVLIEDNCEYIKDFIIYEEQDKIRLLTIGYARVYTPNPMSINVWELENNQWNGVNLKIDNSNSDIIRLEDNEVIIEDYSNYNNIKIDDNNKNIEFNIGNEKFILKIVGSTVILEPM